MGKTTRIKLNMAGQEYTLKAPAEAQEGLEQIAATVDERVGELQAGGLTSTARAALMAAFQFAYELSEAGIDPGETGGGSSVKDAAREQAKEARKRLKKMISRIDEAIE